MDDDTRTSIEKLAYAYWQERGCPIGSPEIDWVRAEQQLAGETVSESYGENQTDIVVGDEGHVSSVEHRHWQIPVTSGDHRPAIPVTAKS